MFLGYLYYFYIVFILVLQHKVPSLKISYLDQFYNTITVNTILTFLFPVKPFFLDKLGLNDVFLIIKNQLQNTQNK